MRSFLGSVLATLLVVTTPVGVGQGVHQGDLLHPAFPHMHFVNGRLALDEAVASTPTRGSATSVKDVHKGPALGAGAGADGAGLGVAISPTVPRPTLTLPIDNVGRLGLSRTILRREYLATPPDPPPQPA